MTPRTAYIGLGANLGDREATLREAVRRLGALGDMAVVSSLYETDPIGYLDQPAFLNAVAAIETRLEPAAMVSALLAIEGDMGRARTFRNAPRTLDLDLLLLGDVVLDAPGVTVPHPRLHERAFVLVPLAEIAPDVVHPTLQRPIAALRDAVSDASGVRQLARSGWEAIPTEVETSPAGAGDHD